MIVFAGPPGAGKSLQAEMLEKETGIRWLSTGQLLRDHFASNPSDAMLKGDLVSDDITQSILEAAIEATPGDQRILLDGYPRNESQVDWLLDYLDQEHTRHLYAIVHITLPIDVAIDRLLKRGRADDKEDVIRHRYKLQYEDAIVPLLEKISQHREIEIDEINGDQSIEEVHADLVAAIKEYL